MSNIERKHGEVIIYRTREGKISLNVKLQKETIWLTQKQMAELFQTDRSVVTRHINNIFKSGELKKNSVCAFFAHTSSDKKVYKTKYYNFDMIISLGYRVNAKRGIHFRIWATQILKKYLIEGYALNEQRLRNQKDKIKKLKYAIRLLKIS